MKMKAMPFQAYMQGQLEYANKKCKEGQMSNEWRTRMQMDDQELAELAELQQPPAPAYKSQSNFWPTLTILAALAGLGYLFWSRV